MLGQALLDRMELVNAELQCQPGETDVTKGLTALNVGQDYFETLAAARGKLFAGSPKTVTTANAVETTALPAGTLRIDALQRLDTNGNPVAELIPLQRTGGHAVIWVWPYNLVSSVLPGVPSGYWGDGTSFYWSPVPDGAYTIRVYGFFAAADVSAAGTFVYPDMVAFPLASFAAALIKVGLDDDAGAVMQLAEKIFAPVLDVLANQIRDGAKGLQYTRVHQS